MPHCMIVQCNVGGCKLVKLLGCVDMGNRRVDVSVCSKRYQGQGGHSLFTSHLVLHGKPQDHPNDTLASSNTPLYHMLSVVWVAVN